MKDLKTFFKNFKFSFGGRLFGFGTSPESDWKVIFISSVVLTIAVIAGSVFMFIKIDKGEIFVSKGFSSQEENTLDIELLRETVSYYQNKIIEFEENGNLSLPTVDPSL